MYQLKYLFKKILMNLITIIKFVFLSCKGADFHVVFIMLMKKSLKFIND